jgi:hypothetical protein
VLTKKASHTKNVCFLTSNCQVQIKYYDNLLKKLVLFLSLTLL